MGEIELPSACRHQHAQHTAHSGLRVLNNEIDLRARAIVNEQSSWPCRKGCDACCHRLAAIPWLTPPEWELLEEGLAKLPEKTQQEITERVQALRDVTAGPLVCPFLDRASHACLVYEQRPVACRTYGFYRERDRGLYCREIEAMVDRGECDSVIWGNAAGVDAKVEALGHAADLRAWSSFSMRFRTVFRARTTETQRKP